jgi:Zn finger protein HypA/HybF involved in hydrogenase expression
MTDTIKENDVVKPEKQNTRKEYKCSNCRSIVELVNTDRMICPTCKGKLQERILG